MIFSPRDIDIGPVHGDGVGLAVQCYINYNNPRCSKLVGGAFSGRGAQRPGGFVALFYSPVSFDIFIPSDIGIVTVNGDGVGRALTCYISYNNPRCSKLAGGAFSGRGAQRPGGFVALFYSPVFSVASFIPGDIYIVPVNGDGMGYASTCYICYDSTRGVKSHLRHNPRR